MSAVPNGVPPRLLSTITARLSTDLFTSSPAAMQLVGPQTRCGLPLVIHSRTTSVGSFGPLAFSRSSRRYARNRGPRNGPLFSRFEITAIERFSSAASEKSAPDKPLHTVEKRAAPLGVLLRIKCSTCQRSGDCRWWQDSLTFEPQAREPHPCGPCTHIGRSASSTSE